MSRLLASVALALLALSAGTAAAQAHEPPPEAMVLFERARQQYRQGEYAAATENLERALVLDPSAPTLLLNLARVYELMGAYDRSISVYRRLLAVTPADQPEERRRTQSTIDRLEGAREHRAPPPPPTAEEERGPTFVRERGVADDAFWGTVIGGAGLVLAAAGCWIGGLLMHDYVAAYTVGLDGTYDDRQAALGTAQSLGIATDVLGALSAATFVAAGLLWVLRERTYETWSVGAVLLPDAGVLAFGARL